MSLPFFYELEIPVILSHFTLSEETSKHCIQVLRMKSGERLQLTNGRGDLYLASILKEDKKNTVVIVESSKHISQNPKKISCAISLLKNANRFEWLLEKITEMGVTEIQPILCTRTEQARFRQDRLQGIVIAAMLQSEQVWLPLLRDPLPVKTCIRQSSYQQKLIAHCEENKKTLIKDLANSTESQILIGPEGDFTSDEINFAIEHKYLPVSLGETRLRSETAGVVATALLMNS